MPVAHRVRLAVCTAAVAVAVGACGEVTSEADGPILPFEARAPALPLVLPTGDEAPPAEDRAPATPRRRERTPEPTGDPRIASGAPSDAQIAAELRQAFRTPEGETATDRDIVDTATLTPDGLATIPPTAPPAVRAIIHAGNQVARKPYVYGGGHGRFSESKFIDTAYDCSGSISYAFAAAGLIDGPMVSGALAEFGEAGPGKWVTIYANGGHAFMTVAGLRFDTSGRQRTGSRWQVATRSTAGFTVRHPKGL